MELVHNFPVQAEVGKTWSLLTDVSRVAKCMPGAQLDEESADPYTGTVKVKVGAVAVQLRGSMTFGEVDDVSHNLVMVCEGMDPRGGSGAQAKIAMKLASLDSATTDVTVTTSLQLSGKIAQFGEGMLQDVSNAILGKFLANLEHELAAQDASGDVQSAAQPFPVDDAIDLGAAIFPAFAKRYGAAVIAGASLIIAIAALIKSFTSTPRRHVRN